MIYRYVNKKLYLIFHLFVITCALLLSTDLSFTSFASDPEEILTGNCGKNGDNVTWHYENGTLTISGTGQMIDKNSSNNQMISSGELDTSLVRKVVIEDGVTSIGAYCFFHYENMTELDMADSVTSIGKYAIAGDENLATVHMSNKLTTIQNDSFAGCKALENVELPDTLIYIGGYAFYNCSCLDSIIIPSQVTYIGDYAFSNCDELKTADIRCIITGNCTFLNCGSLTSVTFSPNLKTIGGQCFSHCSDLRSVTFPDNLNNIGCYAFQDCVKLTSVYIPDAVTQIDEGAFLNCSSINTIHLPENLTTISREMLSNCGGITDITLPDSVRTIENNALERLSITEITLPPELTSIGDEAFSDCFKLQDVTYPSCLKTIGKYSFLECYELNNTPLPDSLQSIGEGAFRGCNNFDNVILPEGLTSIGRAAFSPKRIVLPTSLTTLSNYAFGESPCIVYCSTAKQIEYCKEFEYTYLNCSAVMDISDVDIATDAKMYTHTGSEITPNVAVTYAYNGQTIILERDFDYAVEYADNIDMGVGKINITGIGCFDNSADTTFNIYGSIDVCDISLSNTSFTYTGNAITPDVTVRYRNNYLTKDVDYTVTYSNNISIGTAAINVVGIGKYRGTRSLYYYISEQKPSGSSTSNNTKQASTDTKQASADNPKDNASVSNDNSDNNALTDNIIPDLSNTPTSTKENPEYLVGKAYYIITGKNTVAYNRPKSSKYKTIKISTTVKIHGKKYKVTSVSASSCKNCKNLKKVVIGDNVKVIGDDAFANCKKLTSVTFGKNVSKIGKKVLYCDKKIKHIKFKGKKVKSIGKKTFYKVPRSANILVPNSAVKKYIKMINAASK